LVGNLAGAGCAPFPVAAAAAAAACFFASAFCFAAAAAASSCVGSSLSSAPRISKGLRVAMETAAGKVTLQSAFLYVGTGELTLLATTSACRTASSSLCRGRGARGLRFRASGGGGGGCGHRKGRAASPRQVANQACSPSPGREGVSQWWCSLSWRIRAWRTRPWQRRARVWPEP